MKCWLLWRFFFPFSSKAAKYNVWMCWYLKAGIVCFSYLQHHLHPCVISKIEFIVAFQSLINMSCCTALQRANIKKKIEATQITETALLCPCAFKGVVFEGWWDWFYFSFCLAHATKYFMYIQSFDLNFHLCFYYKSDFLNKVSEGHKCYKAILT